MNLTLAIVFVLSINTCSSRTYGETDMKRIRELMANNWKPTPIYAPSRIWEFIKYISQVIFFTLITFIIVRIAEATFFAIIDIIRTRVGGPNSPWARAANDAHTP